MLQYRLRALNHRQPSAAESCQKYLAACRSSLLAWATFVCCKSLYACTCTLLREAGLAWAQDQKHTLPSLSHTSLATRGLRACMHPRLQDPIQLEQQLDIQPAQMRQTHSPEEIWDCGQRPWLANIHTYTRNQVLQPQKYCTCCTGALPEGGWVAMHTLGYPTHQHLTALKPHTH